MRTPSNIIATLPQYRTGILPVSRRAHAIVASTPARSIISIDLLVALPVLLVGLVILSILISILTS